MIHKLLQLVQIYSVCLLAVMFLVAGGAGEKTASPGIGAQSIP